MDKVFSILFPLEAAMTKVTIYLEPTVALFYSRIAAAVGISLEQVLSDALFKLAGELSLEALQAADASSPLPS